MNSAAKYGAGLAFTGFALFTLNWFIETSIAAGTIVAALFTLITFTVGIGLLILHDRSETKREQARERRYRALEERSRIMEESHNWQRERTEWN
jgi:hypothetical protein